MPSQITPEQVAEEDNQKIETSLVELVEASERIAQQLAIITGLDLEKGEA